MKRLARDLVFVASVLLAACESISSRSDYDHSFDFSGYDTFSWISEKPMIVASPEVSPLNEGRIQRAITHTLAARGIRYVANATEADFVIAFTVGMREHIRVDIPTYPYPSGYRRPHDWGDPYYENVDVRDYSHGRLAIDVFDAKSKQPVWTGVGTKSITGSDQANPEALIQKAVDVIMKDFPPGRAAAP